MMDDPVETKKIYTIISHFVATVTVLKPGKAET